MADLHANYSETLRARQAAVPAIHPVLAQAIVKAYGKLSAVPKTKTARMFDAPYSFAPLDAVTELARPILAGEELALLQPVTRRLDGPLVVETWILHASGHLLRWEFETAGTGNAQAIGSAITYARRYCGSGALGLAATDDDDDGAAAVADHPKRTANARTDTALPISS